MYVCVWRLIQRSTNIHQYPSDLPTITASHHALHKALIWLGLPVLQAKKPHVGSRKPQPEERISVVRKLVYRESRSVRPSVTARCVRNPLTSGLSY